MTQADSPDRPRFLLPAPVIAFASWLFPGLGYLLIGERVRGLVTGVTILLVFVFGIALGGVRAINVPGYGEHGILLRQAVTRDGGVQRYSYSEQGKGPAAIRANFLGQVGANPWSICQIFNGPVGIAGGAASVWAARPGPDGKARGSLSHARINDIAVLYTAVAGMLNLLVMVDSAYRADRKARAA